MKIGLVGYPGSGKSTVFGALTGLDVATGYGAGKAHLGAVKVPDARVDALAALYDPKKTTYAEITFSDLGAGKGEGLDRAALNAMRNVDALCQVLRAFPDAAGEPGDPLAELRGLETETLLADLELVEQRVAKLTKDRSNPRELALLERVKDALENERAVRAFALIDLISMLTAGPDECRAWPVARGTLAPRAAGKIHSDIERGFIRAEVIRCEDLLKYGSEAKCKEAGALRIEGKEYVIQDGDVVHFR